MSISLKLKMIAGVFVLLIVTMFGATYVATQKQANDGLLINLAGRQRMLSQKMFKELHHCMSVYVRDGAMDQSRVDNVRNTMKVFEMTLNALVRGGKAPLSLDLKTTEYAQCPPADGKIAEQLKNVANRWQQVKATLEENLAGNFSGDKKDYFNRENVNKLAQNTVLLKEMNSAVVMMQKDSEGKISALLTTQVVIVLIAFGFLVWTVMVVMSISNRMALMEAFCRTFGTGDLTARSDIQGNDELAEMGQSLDDMASDLQNIIAAINTDASDLDGTSVEVLQISKQVSADCGNSSERANSVAAATEEMSSNMISVAAAVEETATNVSTMADSVGIMSETIKSITNDTEEARTMTSKAVAQSQSASQQVDELGTAATQIGRVTEAITEISEQTNLLALNATIEAARAGEAGKGFAVVANEIKDLAKQTAEATLDIRSQIESIQGSTDNTVTEINSIADIINTVDELVSGVASALEEQASSALEISENVDQASAGIMEVTENVAQSSAVSSEVATDITVVHTDIDGINVASDELSTKAGALSSLASALSERVNKFKT